MGKAIFRTMTDLEARAAKALGNARFAPATASKRIAHTIADQVHARMITEKQAVVMWNLCWTYRRSIKDEEVSKVAKAIHEGADVPVPQKELPW